MGEKSKIGINVIYITIIKVMKLIIPLICIPYVSRKLGANNIGVYSYSSALASYFAMIAGLGTFSYGSREIARNRDDIYNRSKVFWEIEIITVFSTFACMLFWVLFLVITGNLSLFFCLLCINIFSVLFEVSWFFYGLEEYGYLVRRSIIVKSLSVISIFCFIKTQDDFITYVIIMAFTPLISNIAVWGGLKKYIILVPLKTMKFKRHIRESLVYFVPTIATSVYTVLDKSVLGFLKNDSYESGCYEQAENVLSIAKGISFGALNVVIGIRNSYLYNKKRIDEFKKNIETSLRFAMFLSVGFMFGILGVANNFILLYLGKGFDLAIPILMILSPTIVLIGISDCLGSQYYIPVGKRSVSARFIVIGSALNLFLNIIMIPLWGAIGATISTVLVELTITFLYVLYAREIVCFGSLFKMIYKKIIAGCGMLGVLHMINGVQLVLHFKFGLQVIFGVIMYVILLLLIKDSETVELVKLINKRVR